MPVNLHDISAATLTVAERLRSMFNLGMRPERGDNRKGEPMRSIATTPEGVNAELILLRTGAQALVQTLGRRKGERFLRLWSARLANLETVRSIMPLPPASERADTAKAQREALLWWQRMAPLLFDALPPD